MSDRKIDLAAIEALSWLTVRTLSAVAQSTALTIAQQGQMVDARDRLALVRAVRAAREVADQYAIGEVDHRALKRLSGALAPFTDSAEVRNDGE